MKRDETTEQKILKAAREEFVRRGLSGSRMQAIAERAKVNKALLHYYFRSKEKLYSEVLSQIGGTFFGMLEQELAQAGPTTDLRVLIRLFVTSHIRTFANNPDFPPLMLHEVAAGGERLATLMKGMLGRYGSLPQRIFTAYRAEAARGNLRPIEPLHFMMNLMGMSVATFVVRTIAGKMTPVIGVSIPFDKAFFDARIEAIVTMACGGIFVKGKRV
jgi:AcrR family transcriptional regulator